MSAADDAIDRIAELIVGSCPMWMTLAEAYSCEADQIHRESIAEFIDDLCRIVHPLRPHMVANPPQSMDVDDLFTPRLKGYSFAFREQPSVESGE